jgi:hypothetical protein
MAHLGLTQTDLEKVGGPSHGWVRRLKAGSGKPSTRHARSLRQLSIALGWDENTAWSLLTDDRSQWSPEVLESEEHDLVYGPAVKVAGESEVSRPAQVVRALTRMFQSDDPIRGLSDEEWDELLAAIEARRPKREGDGQQQASGS